MEPEREGLPVTWSEKPYVVGIDFGTTGSGFTFVGRREDGVVRRPQCYPGQSSSQSSKTPSAVLYYESKAKDVTVVACGAEVERRYAELSQNELPRYRLFKEIKLFLHKQQLPKEYKDKLKGPQVCGAYLQWFKQIILETLRNTFDDAISVEDIQWVVAVPELWNEDSKRSYRLALEVAGFNPNSVLVCYEPELATVHALDGDQSIDLSVGERVMVLDAGGGTVDFSIHEVQERGGRKTIAEHIIGVGALLGSTKVDKLWETDMAQRVGADCWVHWKREQPREYLGLKDDWEILKCQFGINRPRPGSHAEAEEYFKSLEMDLEVPQSLVDAMSPEKRSECGLKEVEPVHQLVLKPYLYHHQVVDDISRMATELLSKAGGRCDKVLLVGGFSQSPMLKEYVQQALGHTVKEIYVPKLPMQSVMLGAAKVGLDPGLIFARRSRATYGVAYCAPHQEGMPEKKFVDARKDFYCCKLFWPYIELGERVEVGSFRQREWLPLTSNDQLLAFKLFMTRKRPSRDTFYIGDKEVYPVGELLVEVDPADIQAAGGPEKYRVTVRSYFGEAELIFRATVQYSGLEKEVKVKFASDFDNTRIPRLRNRGNFRSPEAPSACLPLLPRTRAGRPSPCVVTATVRKNAMHPVNITTRGVNITTRGGTQMKLMS